MAQTSEWTGSWNVRYLHSKTGSWHIDGESSLWYCAGKVPHSIDVDEQDWGRRLSAKRVTSVMEDGDPLSCYLPDTDSGDDRAPFIA
jgi:hypothetical protein